jgi:hypothetical protein
MRARGLLLKTGVIAAALAIGGCSGARSKGRTGMWGIAASQPAGAVATGPSAYGGAPAAQPSRALALREIAESRPHRHLIRNASLTLEARDARQAAAQLVAAARAAGGYVSDSRESVDAEDRRSVMIQVRVPFGRFDRAVQQIEALGRVRDKQITTEDVTEEFIDSQAKLRNLKRMEARLLEHLKRTARLSDILQVEQELNRVRGEIEQFEGRLRFLEHRVTFSTITVTLTEAPAARIASLESYNGGQHVSAAVRSLIAFARVLWTAAIWTGVWAVVWLPIALAVWLAYRRRGEAPAT